MGEYASYLESLQPEQREAELMSSQPKGVKRGASPKKAKQGEDKKIKLESDGTVALAMDSDSDDDDDSSDEDDGDGDKGKSAIQKPKSSLQMFCDTNLAKYRKKNPKMSQQELSRLMAKTYSKLSEDKKKMYENMALKIKKESSQAVKMPAKTAAASKPSAKATLQTSVAKETKSNKKPALNAIAKSTPEKTSKAKASTAAKVEKPIWSSSSTCTKTNLLNRQRILLITTHIKYLKI